MSSTYSTEIYYGWQLEARKELVEVQKYNPDTGEPYTKQKEQTKFYLNDKLMSTLSDLDYNVRKDGIVQTFHHYEGFVYLLGIPLHGLKKFPSDYNSVLIEIPLNLTERCKKQIPTLNKLVKLYKLPKSYLNGNGANVYSVLGVC